MSTKIAALPRRRFGRTEIQMPVLSCGGMRYQQAWGDVDPAEIDPAGQQNLEATIHRALELGINHIETARGYGSSEYQLGRILPTLPRDEIIVQTKIGPKESAEEFLETFETSMQNLCLERVDLLGVHGINTDELLERTLKPGGMMSAIRQLQREGRVGHVGFSTHGPADVIVRSIETGEFDYVNIHWYFVNPFTWPAVEAAKREDLGVFIISPNDKGGQLYAPSEIMKSLCAPLTPMQFNDLYCLARSEVHTLSIGASRPTDFDEHVEAVLKWGGDDELLRTVEARLEEAFVERHGAEWAVRWYQGLPDWSRVPGEVNLHEVLRLWTYGTAFDLVPWAKSRYNLMGQADHWFPGNHVGSMPFDQLDAALVDSPFRQAIPDILRKAHALLHETPVKRASESE